MAELIFGPPIALGLLIGLYEIFLIHRDLPAGMSKYAHSSHALLLSPFFVFVTMNTQFFLDVIPQLAALPVVGSVHGLRIVAGLIAAAKIHGAGAAKTTGGTSLQQGETWFHSILIGALIAAAPYAYPLIEPSLPDWIKF